MKELSPMILARRRPRSVLWAAVAALAVTACLAAPVMPAQASVRATAVSQQNAAGARGNVQPSVVASIVNYATGYCLGTYEGHNNADAVVWRCNTARNQQWSEKVPGNFAEKIENGNHDCLGVAGGSTRQGAHVVAWKCEDGSANQLWVYGTTICYKPGYSMSYSVIENYETGMVIGVSGASTKQGVDLVMWPKQACPGPGDNQNWYWPITA